MVEDPHSELVVKEMRQKLAVEVDAQYALNSQMLESRIQRHFESVVILTEEFKATLPTSKATITKEVKKLETQAITLWNDLIRKQFSGEVWPERKGLVASELKKLKSNIKKNCKQIVSDNRAAIKNFIDKTHTKLQKKFVSEVVNGKAIAYPVTSVAAFVCFDFIINRT